MWYGALYSALVTQCDRVCAAAAETCEVVATLHGHVAPVSSLSLHSSGHVALAVSSRDCVLWHLHTFTRHKTLNGGQEVGIQDVREVGGGRGGGGGVGVTICADV